MVEVQSGTFDIGAAVAGLGFFTIDSGGLLEFAAPVSTGATVSFQGTAATLKLDDVAHFQGVVGGFSFGGAIAFEMARLLEAAGEKVALVAMLDTYPGRMESKLTLFGRFLRLSPVQQYRYALHKIADRKRAQERRKIIALPPALKHVRKCCEIAARNYTPGTYGGKVLLFRAKQKSLRGGRDPHQAWKQWALGGVEIRELAGDHGSIIRPPQVHLLARELAAYLETAGRNSGPQSQQAFAR